MVHFSYLLMSDCFVRFELLTKLIGEGAVLLSKAVPQKCWPVVGLDNTSSRTNDNCSNKCAILIMAAVLIAFDGKT